MERNLRKSFKYGEVVMLRAYIIECCHVVSEEWGEIEFDSGPRRPIISKSNDGKDKAIPLTYRGGP
jgi:hypothetical protein